MYKKQCPLILDTDKELDNPHAKEIIKKMCKDVRKYMESLDNPKEQQWDQKETKPKDL